MKKASIFILLLNFLKVTTSGFDCESTRDIFRESDQTQCQVVASALQDKARGSSKGYAEFKKTVHNRPLKTDQEDSICYTGTSTCCSQQLQYNLSRMARKEFLKSFSSLVLLGTPQCSSLSAANQLLKKQIRSYLINYVDYIRQELKKALCTAKTVKFAFEDISSFEQENFLKNTKEHIVRLFFNSMVDYFGLRIQDRVHYACVRDYMADLAATQIEAAARPFLLYLGRLQLLVKILGEMERFLQKLMETDMSVSCVRELTRMKYCPLCSGHICVRPCREYCHDTVLQCTKEIRANLHVILELRQLFEALWLSLASADALTNLPRFIIDEFLPFLEANAEEILNKSHQCQQWKTPPPTNNRPCNPLYGENRTPYVKLEETLEVEIVNSCSKGLPLLISNIHEVVCNLENYAGRDWIGWPCWTGSYIGRYTNGLRPTDHALDTTLKGSVPTTWNLSAIVNCSSSLQCIDSFKSALLRSPLMTIPPHTNTRPVPNLKAYNEITGPVKRSGVIRSDPPILVLKNLNSSVFNKSDNIDDDDDHTLGSSVLGVHWSPLCAAVLVVFSIVQVFLLL